MNALHVPGPWTLEIYDSNPGGKHSHRCARLIAKGPPWTALADLGFYVEDYERATAHVIEAAPDLLKACQIARAQLVSAGYLTGPGGVVDIIEAAIAKAVRP